MTCIHEKEVYKIAECNLLHDMINPPKCAKHVDTHYYPILHGCMNTRHGGEKFKNYLILLDSGFSSKISMGRMDKILRLKTYDVIKFHTQARNITTNHKVTVYFTLPALSVTNIVTW